VGFFLQMVMGVAYWMMPRPGGLRQDRLEGPTFALLNAGLLLRLSLEPFFLTGDEGLRPWLALSGGLQLLATLVFASAMNQQVVTADMLRKMREARERRGR
jgi:heme exporter protein D